MNGLSFVFLGLSITSSWGNGHATTYRSLIRALTARGHRVLFLERDMPWYAQNRDLPDPLFCRTGLYGSLEELADRWSREVSEADLVVVGSYVPDGIELGNWVIRTARGAAAFYDIDTPVTLTAVARNDCRYLTPELISRYDLYLSFSGGEILRKIVSAYGSPMARPLYCSVDPDAYYPEEHEPRYDLGYMGTYSDDRQPQLERMMLGAARDWPKGRFVVAGPQYPGHIEWPQNVIRLDHVPPGEHRRFYTSQRFTLNVTRAEMRSAGYSPSVRLFEAAACGVPIVSDCWKGLDRFFDLQREILISRSPDETLLYLRRMPDSARRRVGFRARDRVLAHHTSDHRAAELESYLLELRKTSGRKTESVREIA